MAGVSWPIMFYSSAKNYEGGKGYLLEVKLIG